MRVLARWRRRPRLVVQRREMVPMFGANPRCDCPPHPTAHPARTNSAQGRCTRRKSKRSRSTQATGGRAGNRDQRSVAVAISRVRPGMAMTVGPLRILGQRLLPTTSRSLAGQAAHSRLTAQAKKKKEEEEEEGVGGGGSGETRSH